MRSLRLLTLIGALLSPAWVRAQDTLEPIDADFARNVARRLVEEVAKGEKTVVDIKPDVEKASGVHRPEKAGILIIPQEDIREEKKDDPIVKSETGGPLAYVFTYFIIPSVDGKPLAEDKLNTITLTTDEGREVKVHLFVMTAKKVSDDEWKLLLFAKDKKPVVSVKIDQGSGPGQEPLAVEVKEIQGNDGKFVVTLFNKYVATIPVDYREAP